VPKKRSRVFSRAFKLAAVRRMMAGEDIPAVSREPRVLRKDLYYWRTRFRAGGPEALRGKGRPKKTEVVTGLRRHPLAGPSSRAQIIFLAALAANYYGDSALN
jgi:transposase-like protein